MIQNGDILDGMYQIIREIGRGGTGIIYLAKHLRLQKKVVVKKIKDNFAGQVNGRAEVDILKRLHHTFLPQVYDFLVIDRSIYTVMEYVEGQDLEQYLNQGHQFPEETIRRWLLQLCEVLEYLHSQKPPILHSDIKPSNIMITKEGNVCLIDFNISLDGETSKELLGVSPWFSAPEQYEKAMDMVYGRKDSIRLDERMDIYSLGAVFYSMMTGFLPSPDKGQQDILDMDLPYSEGIKAVVSKAMKRKPSARFQTARQMKKVVQDISRMDPRFRRYGRLQAGAGAAWILCVIVGILLLYYGSWQNGIERWREAYRQLYLSTESQEEAEIVSQATDMLNSHTYQGYLTRHPERKAEVLHVLGESYFRQEQFADAVPCYKEAWELEPQKGDYCRDYVIALVRNGQISQAGRILESPKSSRTLQEVEKLLIQAEMDWMDQNYDKALESLEELTALGGEPKVMQEAYLLESTVYEAVEDYKAAVGALEEARNLENSREVLRRMGQAASRAAAESSQEVNRNAYLEKALSCYQELTKKDNPSYEDQMNLALMERALEQYENSNRTLQEMKKEYRLDYLVPMWMCYNYLDLIKAQGNTDDLWTELNFQYQDCRHKYQSSGKTDADMERLWEVMEELEE